MVKKSVAPMSFMPLSPVTSTPDIDYDDITPTPTAPAPMTPSKTTSYGSGSNAGINQTPASGPTQGQVTETLYEDNEGGYITVDNGSGPVVDPGITNLKNILAAQKAEAEAVTKLGKLFPGLSRSQLEQLFKAAQQAGGSKGADQVYSFMQDYVAKNFTKTEASTQRDANYNPASSIGKQTNVGGKTSAEPNKPNTPPSNVANTNTTVNDPSGEDTTAKFNALTDDINSKLANMRTALAGDIKGVWDNIGDLKSTFDNKISLTNNLINQKATVYQSLFSGLDNKFTELAANQGGVYKGIMDRINGYESTVENKFNEMRENLGNIQSNYKSVIETELAGQASGAEKELRGKTGKANALRVANTIGEMNQDANKKMAELDISLGEQLNGLESAYLEMKGGIMRDKNLTDESKLALDTAISEKLMDLDKVKAELQIGLIDESAVPYKEEIGKQEKVQEVTKINNMIDKINSEYAMSSPIKRQELIVGLLTQFGMSVDSETLDAAIKAASAPEAVNMIVAELEKKTDDKNSSAKINELLEAMGGLSDPNGATGLNEGGGESTGSGARTDRHNNPTAMTTDVARTLGLIEGVDYVVGDKFPGESNLRTAKLLGDPFTSTIKAFDTAITKGVNPFYTQKGAPRRSYLQKDPVLQKLTPGIWAAMSPAQKKGVVMAFYKHETPSAQRTMMA